VSDEKYAGNIALEDRKWCPRIFLHAAKIEFYHPLNKNIISIEADLPLDLDVVLKNLKLSA
ncbi:MAG: RNA pseudouridine synthase, partial [Patescibacteria group bacterium]